MLIENDRPIGNFLKKYPFSRNVFTEWIRRTEGASWNNFFELRQTFNSADYRKPFVIFNIGGNKYRILAKVLYETKEVQIVKVGTHEEYNSWKL